MKKEKQPVITVDWKKLRILLIGLAIAFAGLVIYYIKS